TLSRSDGTGALTVLGRNARFAGSGTGAALELLVERLELLTETPQAATGSLVAQGNVSLSARSAEIETTAVAFDPRWFVAEWPGTLDGRAHVRAALAPEIAVAIEDAQLTGRLRGHPVVARGAVQLAGSDAWSFAPLMLESGASRIELEGAIDSERIAVAVDAVVEDIGLLAPGVRGSLDGEATLAGTWSEPRARGDFVARGVAFEG